MSPLSETLRLHIRHWGSNVVRNCDCVILQVDDRVEMPGRNVHDCALALHAVEHTRVVAQLTNPVE